MTYEKPEILVITHASEAVKGTKKKGTVLEWANQTDCCTPNAYESDE